MSKLDDVISDVGYILDCLKALRNICETGHDCNTCTKTCDYRQWSRQVTYNCPLWEGRRMSEQERKTMLILADTLVGEINRMCVTKDLSEFDTMYGHAKKNLDKLSKMIYDSKFKEGNP